MSRRTRALIAEMFADVREQLRALPWKDLQPVEVRQVQEVGDASQRSGKLCKESEDQRTDHAASRVAAAVAAKSLAASLSRLPLRRRS